MIYITLLICGMLGWLVSTIAAGGAATLLIPVIGFLLGPQLVAPVISVAATMANPSRIVFFFRYIHWPVVQWLVPGSILGAVIGAYTFTRLNLEWLQVVIGLFLVTYVLQHRFSRIRFDFSMERYWFLPIGLTISFLSGLVGATGPVLNPFLLAYGLQKEELVATKSVNSLIMQITKLSTYTIFGVLTLETGSYGIVLGLGAIIGVYLARAHLQKITTEKFLLYVHALLFISGCIMLVQALI